MGSELNARNTTPSLATLLEEHAESLDTDGVPNELLDSATSTNPSYTLHGSIRTLAAMLAEPTARRSAALDAGLRTHAPLSYWVL